MKLHKFLVIVLFAFSTYAFSQSITVHVIEEQTQKPVGGIHFNLRRDCDNPKRPKAIQVKADENGTAVFPSVQLSQTCTSLDLFSMKYYVVSPKADYVFIRTGVETSFANPPITKLPADITFVVKKRTFAEQMQYIFMGD